MAEVSYEDKPRHKLEIRGYHRKSAAKISTWGLIFNLNKFKNYILKFELKLN